MLKHLLLKKEATEEGQGLVEYALILVLVAIVVIAILLLLGPKIFNVYGQVAVVMGLDSSGVVTNVSANRVGGSSGGAVKVDITVSESTDVTVTDSQGGSPMTVACPGSCSPVMGGIGSGPGIIVVTAAKGGVGGDKYEAQQ